ncbi:hypothetical protein XENOCAPTIV_023365 [Xenoophorus captivus]|uniref:Uncharacterized protein n=1 Tax=Xenoophorus captivus TaxID=1517983 RepID=A0ABV0QJQ4_9TELE
MFESSFQPNGKKNANAKPECVIFRNLSWVFMIFASFYEQFLSDRLGTTLTVRWSVRHTQTLLRAIWRDQLTQQSCFQAVGGSYSRKRHAERPQAGIYLLQGNCLPCSPPCNLKQSLSN